MAVQGAASAQSRLSFFLVALCVGLVAAGTYHLAFSASKSSILEEQIEIQEADAIFHGDGLEVIHPLAGFALTGDFIVAYINVSLSKLTSSTVLRLTLLEMESNKRHIRLVPLDLAKAESLGPLWGSVIVGQRLALAKKPSPYILSVALLPFVSTEVPVMIEARPTRFTVLAENSSDWAVFAAWLRGNQATWHFEMGNIVAPSGETYRGALVTEDLSVDSVVADIPNSVAVEYARVIRSPFLRWIGKRLLEAKNDDIVFAAYLAWCSMYAEHCPHAPYVRYLPTPDTIPYLPLWWSSTEIALFEGTSLAHEILSSKTHHEGVVAEVEELLQSNEELSQTIDRYLIQYSIVAVATRCWGLEVADDERRLRLCPLLDLLNHHIKANQINLEKTGHSRSLTGIALKAGDEAWMNYGADKSANSKLLLYGWLSTIEEVRICRIINLPNVGAPFGKLRGELISLAKARVYDDYNHCIGVGASNALEAFMLGSRISHLTLNDLENRTSIKIVTQMERRLGVISAENEKHMLDDVQSTFAYLKLAVLEKITEEDEQIVDGSIRGVSYLRHAAAVFKVGELRVCEWIIAQVDERRALKLHEPEQLAKKGQRRHTGMGIHIEPDESDEEHEDLKLGED